MLQALQAGLERAAQAVRSAPWRAGSVITRPSARVRRPWQRRAAAKANDLCPGSFCRT